MLLVPAVESALGELPALLVLPGFALLGSELAGVRLRSADRLALFMFPLTLSGPPTRGGDTDWFLGGVILRDAGGIAGSGP